MTQASHYVEHIMIAQITRFLSSRWKAHLVTFIQGFILVIMMEVIYIF